MWLFKTVKKVAAIYFSQVSKLQGKIKSPQYLNCIKTQYQEKERKSGVFGYECIVQGANSMEIEFTKGFLMFWGGIVGVVVIFIVVVVYLILSAKKAKQLLNDIVKEDF